MLNKASLLTIAAGVTALSASPSLAQYVSQDEPMQDKLDRTCPAPYKANNVQLGCLDTIRDMTLEIAPAYTRASAQYRDWMMNPVRDICVTALSNFMMEFTNNASLTGNQVKKFVSDIDNCLQAMEADVKRGTAPMATDDLAKLQATLWANQCQMMSVNADQVGLTLCNETRSARHAQKLGL